MISVESIKKVSLPVIDTTLLIKMRQVFDNYTLSFRSEDDALYNRHIELKRDHTLRVCNEILKLGIALGMNSDQLAFAEIIAILHDIGRFEQFDRYGTFADAESENHAEIGIRVIESSNMINDLEPENQQILIRAILNHNIPRVPDNELPFIDFYSRLLRDADKLDIWRIVIETNIFHKIKAEILPPSYKVPSELFECFKQNRIITIDKVNSFYDSILFRIGWVFDLNFAYSIRVILNREIITHLLNKLPQSEALLQIQKLVQQYIQSNI